MTPDTVFPALLAAHILGGSFALLAGYGALLVKRGGPRHRTLGQVYTWGMLTVVVTGFPMSIINPNPFLFGIVIFSGYFVLSGWIAARYRNGQALWAERIAGFVLLGASVVAVVLLLLNLSVDAGFSQTYWITGLVFALIGLGISIRDLLELRGGPLGSKDRIIKHLVSMCAALIATTTAVAVTVLGALPFVPELVLWLGPTVILSPVISYWAKQVRAGTFRY